MRYLLFFLTLCLYQTVCFASFSISGSVITQSGTNTSLNSIQNLSGVSVSTQNDIRVYNIGNRRLVINGNLTIDPETEMLIVGYNSGEMVVVQNNGSLTIGREIVVNGFSRYSEGMAIYLENCPPGFTNRFSFKGNSTFNWFGGVISQQAGKFGFYGNNVTIRIHSENAKLIYRTIDSQNQIRQETNDFIADALTLINGDLTVVSATTQLNGYNPIHCSGAIAFSGSTPNQDVVFNGYRGGGNGNLIDIKFWQGSRPVFYNSLTGSELITGPHISGSASSYGAAMIYQKLKVETHLTNGTAVEGAKCFIRDTNHGNRKTYNKEGHSINNTQDKTYTLITNASGESNIADVLIGSVLVNTGNGNSPNTGNYSWDYRGKENNHSDLFDLNFWNYETNYLQLPNVELKGVNTVVSKATLLTDGNISKSKSDAMAINGISIVHNPNNDEGTITISEQVTLCDLYDFVKLNKVDFHIEEPSIDKILITVIGNNLNIGDYQLVLTNGASLESCEKFQKLTSNKVSVIDDVSQNLKIALTDPNGTYKLMRLINLENALYVIKENVNSTILATDTNITGIASFVTQTNAPVLSFLVQKEGFTNWSADVDITSNDVFNLFVFHSDLANAIASGSTLENQELELYLIKKLLAKNEAIANSLSNVNDLNIIINSINQPGLTNASLEKQEELLELLKQVLLITTKINTSLSE